MEKCWSLKSLFVEHGPLLAKHLLRNPLGQQNVRHDPVSFGLDRPLPLQPIIRDVWWDHVLFTENRVTGLIDFGAMQVDSVSFDIARLLGSSLDRTDSDLKYWEAGISDYQKVRPLTEFELQIIIWIDQTGVLLGVGNWLRWIWLEQRPFENIELVDSRIDHLLRRFITLQTSM